MTRIAKINAMAKGISVNEEQITSPDDAVVLKKYGATVPKGKLVGRCPVTGMAIVQPQTPFPPDMGKYKWEEDSKLYRIPDDLIDSIGGKYNDAD